MAMKKGYFVLLLMALFLIASPASALENIVLENIAEEIVLEDAENTIVLNQDDGETSVGDEPMEDVGADDKAIEGDFEIQDGVLVRYSGAGGEVVIPEGVTEIASGVFKTNAAITKVDFPTTLKKIGDEAFSECENLTGDLIIPDSVTSIGKDAFSWCTGFDGRLQLSKNLTAIPDYAFFACWNFTGDLIIPDSVTSIGTSAFSGFGGSTQAGDPIMNSRLHLPENLEVISWGAFSECGFIGDLIIPDSVTSIDGFAFCLCTGFTGDLIIPDRVTNLGEGAFMYCSGLDGVLRLGENIPLIDSSAFFGCENLTGELLVPEGAKSIGDSAFAECRKITKVTIPKSVTKILANAFFDAPLLDTMIFKGTQPPVLEGSDTGGSHIVNDNRSAITLYVPAVALADYHSAYDRYGFKAILADPDGAPPPEEEKPIPPGIIEEPEATDSGIQYREASYIVPADTESAYIDLAAETMVLPIEFAAKAYAHGSYSVNGGKNWKNGAMTDALLKTSLNKALTLHLADALVDNKTKKPAAGAQIIQFPAISARPKANAEKLTVNYSIYADTTGKTNGRWTLSNKEGSAGDKSAAYQIAGIEGNAVDSKGWGYFDAAGMPMRNAETKASYFVRSAPVAEAGKYIPASKQFKINPQNALASTKIKANYANETITIPDNTVIFAGALASLPDAQPTKQSGAVTIQAGDLIQVNAANGITVDISGYLGQDAKPLVIWKQAASTKPSTRKQQYWLAPRSVITAENKMAYNGKLSLDAKYQVKNANGNWGKLPKIQATVTLPIRIKPTVKATGAMDSGNAASVPGTVLITYGEFWENKVGIISAQIKP